MLHATPRVQARARQIAAVTGTQPVLSYVTASAELPQAEDVRAAVSAEKLSAHTCKDCNTGMVTASVVAEPHCVNCGSANMTLVSATAAMPERIASEADLTAVKCACSTVSIVDKKVLASTGGHMHCVVCSSQLQVNSAANEDKPDDSEDADNGEAKEEAVTKTTAAEGVELSEPGAAPEAPAQLESGGEPPVVEMKTDDAAPEVPNDTNVKVTSEAETGGDEDLVITDDDMVSLEDLDDADDVVATWGGDNDVVSSEVLDVAEVDGENLLLQNNGNPGELERQVVPNDMQYASEMTGDPLGMEDLGLDSFEGAEADPFALDEAVEGDALADTVGLDDTVQACYMIQAGSKLIAMKGHHAIATLSEKAAGKNADIMGTPSFAQAVLSQASNVGLRKALASFKFSLIKTPVKSAVTVQRQVAAASSRAEATFNAKLKVQADCLALAAAGLARGMWKGQPNPLKAALESEFMRLGVRQPGKVAAALLTEHGMEYAKVLSAQAQRLAGLSDSSRREIADMLDLVTDGPVQDLALDEGAGEFADAHSDEMPNNEYEYDGDSVAARFVQPAAPAPRQTAALFRPGQRVTSGNADAQAAAQAILSGKRGLGFEA